MFLPCMVALQQRNHVIERSPHLHQLILDVSFSSIRRNRPLCRISRIVRIKAVIGCTIKRPNIRVEMMTGTKAIAVTATSTIRSTCSVSIVAARLREIGCCILPRRSK